MKNLLFLSFLLTINLYANIPQKPVGYVNDFANILDDKTKSELLSLIIQVEQKTSAEIAMVTVSSLEGMSVEDYAEKLFKKWGIGKKRKDNGVLVLIAPNERKVRIEVGYGLEPVLPDGLVGEIIREQFIPAFKRNNFSDGITSGVKRIVQIIERNEPAPKFSFAGHPQWISLLSLSIFFLVFFVVMWNSASGRGGGDSGWSGSGGFYSGGGGFGGFGGGSSGGGGASGSW
ncbi:MAG: TPM domain-containing protein [Elusimicrobia bacterium]|nr:TPM domain-containing protein [Elusimicrobiota bacterium]